MAVRLIFSFDSEDYITPAADDAEKWWAETMSKHGITACICVVGELVRALQVRWRRDVLTAMASHEIAYHPDKHSAPPTWAEILDECGWQDGEASLEDFLNAVFYADEFCTRTGCVPDQIVIGRQSVGPNAFMQALAWLLRQWRTIHSLPASIPLTEVPELPKIANEPQFRDYRFKGTWIIFPPEFEGLRTLEHIRLQTWTIKPAIPTKSLKRRNDGTTGR